MTVLEFFDYEKQLLADFDAVKTPHARNAIYKEIVDVLESHKRFVTNTIQNFEQSLKEAHNDAKALVEGKTPAYVTKMMADFGFHELEEDDGNYSEYIAQVVEDFSKEKDVEAEKAKRAEADKPSEQKKAAAKKKRQPKAKKTDKAAEEDKAE
jgi:hypothetical protein